MCTPLCTERHKIKSRLRDCKYPQRARSRGPRTKPRPPQYLATVAEGPPSFDGPRQRKLLARQATADDLC
jgi:hypothetical protein